MATRDSAESLINVAAALFESLTTPQWLSIAPAPSPEIREEDFNDKMCL